jgi:predicted transposase/invertase (TIGR01784 family)
LRDKANFDILEGFLSTLLKQDIKVISLLESESPAVRDDDETDKFNRVDLVVEDQNKDLLVVEIQNNREVHYLERLVYGSAKLIVDHLKLGESYAHVKKVISISILYFLLGEGETDYVYHGATEFYGLNNRSRLTLKPAQKQAIFNGVSRLKSNVFPEYYLIEVEKFQNLIQSDLDEWIYFFKNSEIKKEFKAKNIQLVQEKLDLMKMSEAERRAYERFLMNKASERDVIETAKIEGHEEGREEGLKEGRETGLKEGHETGLKEGREAGLQESRLAMARAMLSAGEPLEKIERYTGLPEQEILKLQA